MLKCLQDLDLPNESSRPLIITEDVLEALTRVVLLGWPVHDVHHFAVAAFTELLYLGELGRHHEVLVET